MRKREGEGLRHGCWGMDVLAFLDRKSSGVATGVMRVLRPSVRRRKCFHINTKLALQNSRLVLRHGIIRFIV